MVGRWPDGNRRTSERATRRSATPRPGSGLGEPPEPARDRARTGFSDMRE